MILFVNKSFNIEKIICIPILLQSYMNLNINFLFAIMPINLVRLAAC